VNIKPPRLKHGQEIGIIAPAGPVTQSEIQPGIDLLESFGYKVIPSPHLYHREGYVAGDDDTRLGDLHSMFHNKNIKAILCARGGYGTLRLLDKINFDLIRLNPKMILGYSDITTILWAIYKKTGLVTFHGPVVKDLAKKGSRDWESFFDLVSSDKLLKLNLTEGLALIPGQARGTLLGGNLSLICHLIGTHFMPSLKGAILFIEEKEEPLYRIDRMLTHLRLSGLLENLAGLIAGSFEGCGNTSSINQLLLDTLSHVDIPVVSGLPVGHGLENFPLPLGVMAALDTEQMTLSITEPCITP
jgi:muramoyltetrapeptide carboxypeptidase